MTTDAYRVILSPRALGELTRIHDFIANSSPANARNMTEELIAAIYSLESLPHRYQVFAKQRGRRRDIRRMPVPPYTVYYYIVESPRAVRILSVRHGSRRPPSPGELN